MTRPGRSIQLVPGDRVLVTRLDFLGDVVLSLPLVDALHARWPGIEIDYLCRPPASELLRNDTRFGRVFSLAGKPGAVETLRMIRRLRGRRYRAVVDLFGNPRSMWLTVATGAPVRAGRTRGWRRRMYTHTPALGEGARDARTVHMETAAALGVGEAEPGLPRVEIDESLRKRAEKTVRGLAGGRRAIGIHPGGKWAVKRWPSASFAELATEIVRELDAHVILFTGPGEENHTEAVARRAGECGGRVSVIETRPVTMVAALIASLDAMVACDGGVMHVSVGAGVPTVGIFGSAEPELWFPYEHQGPFRAAFVPLDCRPCHRHVCPLGTTECLNALAVSNVMGTLHDVLEPDRPRGRGGR